LKYTDLGIYGDMVLISKGGIISCSAGVLFYLAARATGGDAKRLRDARRVHQLSDLTEVLEVLPIIVAIRGIVGSREALVAENSLETGVILENVVEQHYLRRADGSEWVRDAAVVSQTCREVPWYLEDGSGTSVWVEGARSGDGLHLHTVSDTFDQDAFKGMVRVSIDYLRGVKDLGMRCTERMLPVKTPLTVVGEVSANPSGVLTIARPTRGKPFYVTSLSLDELLASLGAVSRTCKVLSIGCTLLGVYLFASTFARSMLTRYRAHQFRRRMAKQTRANPALDRSKTPAGGLDEHPASDVCIVCLEQPYGAVFKECGHMCCCMACASQLSRCPLCRAHSGVIRVYKP